MATKKQVLILNMKNILIQRRFYPTVKQLSNITETLAENWKKIYASVIGGKNLHALIRLEQTVPLTSNKIIFFRSSIITSDEEVLKVMSWDKMANFCHPYRYSFPLNANNLAKDLDLARAQVTEHLYKQPIQRPGQLGSQDDYIPYIQQEINPIGHKPLPFYQDVLGITKMESNTFMITSGEVKNNAHISKIKFWYRFLEQTNKFFVEALNPMDFFTPGSYSFEVLKKQGFNLDDNVDSDGNTINIILYKHLSLAVSSDQYYELKNTLGNPIVREKIKTFMEKSNIHGIDVQLWDVIPSYKEISPSAKLEYESLATVLNELS